MNRSVSLTLYSLLLLLLLPLTAADAEAAQVMDITGNKLRAGVDYFILPIVQHRGGGLTLATYGNKTCPLSVGQERHEADHGVPLKFSPVNPKIDAIQVSTDLNIKSSAATNCTQSTVWKLDHYDESTGQYFITTGGVEGNPGRETISNWFKIEKEGSDYKLAFCPMVCNYCKVICRYVGFFNQSGRRRLALSDLPFLVKFWRV